jgi:hypothetical protein
VNVAELRAAVASRGQSSMFDIRSVAQPSATPDNVHVVEPVGDDTGRWVVYYIERGEWIEPEYFESENDACEYALSILNEPPAAAYTPSAEADAAAARLAQDDQDELRRMLRERGIDPDAG